MASEKRTRARSRRRNQLSPSSEKHGYRTFGIMFHGDLDPVPTDKTIDPPPRTCYNCWSFEHTQQFCTKLHTCYCCNCGRRGLKVAECPRCARRFHLLDDHKKDWIYKTFYKIEKYKTDDKKQTTDYDKNRETRNKLNEYKDEDFGWEPVKSYHSLTAFAESKIRDEFESDKINNVAVNLDDTRIAYRDSFEEISNVSTNEFSKKDEDALRSTGEPLQDFLILLSALKHLPVTTQNIVVLQYMSERKKQMIEDEMQSVKKIEYP